MEQKTHKAIKEGIFLLFILLLLVFALLNRFKPELAQDIFGINFFAVRSDSMVPIFRRGDSIVISKAKAEELRVNDIIAAKRRDDMLVAHYIAEVFHDEDGGLAFKTKPANAKDKSEWDFEAIRPEQILGKYSFSIPYLGHLLLFISSKEALITVPALLALSLLLGSSRGQDQHKQREAMQPFNPKPDLPLHPQKMPFMEQRIPKVRKAHLTKQKPVEQLTRTPPLKIKRVSCPRD